MWRIICSVFIFIYVWKHIAFHAAHGFLSFLEESSNPISFCFELFNIWISAILTAWKLQYCTWTFAFAFNSMCLYFITFNSVILTDLHSHPFYLNKHDNESFSWKFSQWKICRRCFDSKLITHSPNSYLVFFLFRVVIQFVGISQLINFSIVFVKSHSISYHLLCIKCEML